MSSVALPRPRVRLRRPRPPHPRWVFATLVCVGTLLLTTPLLMASGASGVKVAASLATNCCWIGCYWPQLRSPYRAVMFDQRWFRPGFICWGIYILTTVVD